MADVRCWMYVNQAKQGWKESFYLSGTTLPGALAQLGRLALARAALLGDPCQVVRILVTNEPPNREYLAMAGPPSSGLGPALSPYTALLVRLQVGPAGLYHRQVYIRGLPKSWVTGPSLHTLELTTTGRQLVLAYIKAIVDLGFSIRSNDKTAPSYPIIDVQPQVPEGFVLEPSPWVLLSTAQNTGLTTLDGRGKQNYATVAGVQWLPEQVPGRKVNGVWPILAVGVNQVILSTSAPAEGIYLGGGFVQGRGVVFSPITGGIPLRFVQKDTGRALPFEGVAALVPPGPPRIGEAFEAEGPGTTPFFVYPGPVIITPGGKIQNSLDMAAFVFSGYPSTVLSIAVAADTNHPGSYVIAIPGTNADTSADALGAIQAGFVLPSQYTDDLLAAILVNVPPGSKIVLAGHSQGAMVAQNIIKKLFAGGYVPTDCLCYGAPVTTMLDERVHYVFFRATYDYVPLLTFNILDVPGPTELQMLKNSTVIVENNASAFAPADQHNCYDRTPFLTGYDALGYKISVERQQYIIQLGPVTRYGVAPPS